jgi:hypothetical protein
MSERRVLTAKLSKKSREKVIDKEKPDEETGQVFIFFKFEE